MNKMYLALALIFVGCAVSLSAQTTENQIAVYLTEKYCTTTTA